MKTVRRFDSLVIGGGMSGLPLAVRAARHGTTAFVERELLGGTCLNRGCIPTKTMIASAKVAQQVRRFFRDQSATIADRVVPHTVFTDPEVASVGLAETQARAAGYDVAVGSQPFAGVAKANAIGETRGFITFVADASTDRILGCHIIGPEAGNLIHEAVIAMVGDIPYRDIGRAIHVHPTLAEGVNAAAGGVHRPSA